MRKIDALRSTFKRNKLLVAIVALSFLSLIAASALVSYVFLATSSQIIGPLQAFMERPARVIGIPRPYTSEFYRLIFLNNIGHFWNPARILVWAPFIGVYSMGLELLLNAMVIGGAITFATITKGPSYALIGLIPHGIFEMPAFILEFTALTRWQISTTRAIYTKLGGRYFDRPLLMGGLKDTLVLSLISVVLFAIAAYVETYVTPRFLGL